MTLPRLAAFGLALVSIPGFAFAGNVRIAERPQVGTFTTLQAAVNSALEGETLLVTPGTYASFTVDGKSLEIFVTGNGLATIPGQVIVKNLASSQYVVLSRFSIKNTYVPPSLEITNAIGHVRVQDSTIEGQGGIYGQPTAGTAARIVASLNIVFSGCSLLGGDAGWWSGEATIDGGVGVDSVNSSVALYDCTIEGGSGGLESYPAGGHGGDGYTALSYGLFAAGCTFRGGDGGYGDVVLCTPGGSGGDALQVDAAQAQLLQCTFTAGGGGYSPCGSPAGPGQTIVSLNGSFINQMAGSRRKISAPSITADDASVPITITGQPGDLVYLLVGRKPAFVWQPASHGAWLVKTPLFMNSLPAGIIGAGGTLVVPRTFEIHATTVAAGVAWLQVLCIDTSGQATLTGPANVVSLNAASAPDCDGNGRQDVLDLLFGGAVDCNSNGIPDSCDLGNGAPDCNANGLLDSCDIAAHISLDVNFNGVPDECEAQYLTWYVDDSAAAGGNGSQAAPFRYIKDAVTASISGDTIVLEDGLYQGQKNYEVNFNGRDLTLRSANGPSNCTIDCQSFGRALLMNLNEHVLVEGIAFLNGRASGYGNGGAIMTTGADLTLRNCTFTNGIATSTGGAISSVQGTLRLEGCSFTGNTAFSISSGRYGGAVFADRAKLYARDCLFANNQASMGGSFYVRWPGALAVFTHCTFLENHANWDGGAGKLESGGTTHTFDDCLFAGNSANTSGGAISSFEPMNITNSTFVSNTAVDRGGAVYFQYKYQSTFRNSIAWNNSAGTGSQFCLAQTLPALLIVSSSDVQGGQAGVAVTSGNLSWGAGNIDVDPQFADMDGPDNNPLTFGDNDYRLSSSSACIDAGDNGALIPDVLDIDGDGNTTEPMPLDRLHATRRVDVISVPDTGLGAAPIVDLGAFERPG